jgi:hypothetical protein
MRELGEDMVVQSDSLGQPNTVVDPIKDTVILPDKNVPQDPQLGIAVSLEAAGAEALVLEEARLR